MYLLGVTFDTGGISIKPAAKMGLMKGDMGGAAVVCATMFAIASLKLPINVVALTPLCENMPSGCAYKPGDVVTAMNGKTIEVEFILTWKRCRYDILGLFIHTSYYTTILL